ncbi:amidohydrolase family protein [Mucilaginibacter sp. UYCu711]|uniref:amidohydrolase family protein n=1 Tax=Mucilaginibacter sp. UYCu711 TaxID=3156339 RepID=UPI003D243338
MMQRKSAKTAIINANVFNGVNNIGKETVVFENGIIIAIGGAIPDNAKIIDGEGATLLPGLIDSHVHTSVDGLREALRFGVTTELEMAGGLTKKGRELQLKGIDDIADVRSAGLGLSAPGGHPDELLPDEQGIPDFILKKMEHMSEEDKSDFLELLQAPNENEEDGPDVTTITGALLFVNRQVDNGADYFKVMIEEGTILNAPGLPMISTEVMKAAVDEAHRLNKMAIAHVLTAETTKIAIEIGMDGLAHLFIDRPQWTPDLITAIATSGVFVTPCLVLNSSIIGKNACHIAHDERVINKLDQAWVTTMCSCFHTFPEGDLQDSFKNLIDLHNAGVDLLIGTDVSLPVPRLGGLAHGVSVHHEMQLFVEAGLSPVEALRAATSVPARRFGLHDRGMISVGNRADLLLVKGDPTQNISDSLSLIAVWKAGIDYN